MRIVISVEAFHPANDADTRTAQAVADHLIDTGHAVLLLTHGPGLPEYRGAKVARIPRGEGRGVRVHEALVDFAADLVIAVAPGGIGRKALKHGRKLLVPTLAVQTAPVPALEAERWSRTVGRRAGRIVVTAPWLLDRVAELGRPDAEIWEPGTDTDAFSPALRDTWLHADWSKAKSPGGQRVVVGHAGELRRRFGVRRLLDAVQDPGTRLVVVGEGKQKEWLADRAPGAKMTGARTDGDLATALASMDIVVMPNEHETCAHLLRAAMASGVPVVAPDRAGAADLVEHEVTGLLYDPDQTESLRRTVFRLLADPELGRTLAAAARRRVEQRDWATAVDELLAVHVLGTTTRDDSAA